MASKWTDKWTDDPGWNAVLDTDTRYARESESNPHMRRYAQGWRNRRWEALDAAQAWDRKWRSLGGRP